MKRSGSWCSVGMALRPDLFFLISFVYLDMLVCIRSCILTDTVRVYKQGLNIDNRQ